MKRLMKIYFRFNIQKLYTPIILASLVIKAFFFLPLVSLAQQPALNVELVGRLAGGIPHSVFVKDNYAYVAAGGILNIIDVSNPKDPKEVGYCYTSYTSGEAGGVYVLGNYAYVAGWKAGLRIIDVSDPRSPKGVGYYKTPGDAWGVYVLGNYAYVANGKKGLRIIDVSDPRSPKEVGYYKTSGEAGGVYVLGNYAYVAGWKAGLRIIDVSTPRSPKEVGYYTPGWACGVYVLGRYIYHYFVTL